MRLRDALPLKSKPSRLFGMFSGLRDRSLFMAGGALRRNIFLAKCFRACSYDPAYRDVSLTETNISVRSYGIFRPACRDEITL